MDKRLKWNLDVLDCTAADIEAYKILLRAGKLQLRSNQNSFIDAGNQILELAGRIKAQRSAIALMGGNNDWNQL